ncbi:MAG: FecR domain-containing protein [Pseudomonadales bacterium]
MKIRMSNIQALLLTIALGLGINAPAMANVGKVLYSIGVVTVEKPAISNLRRGAVLEEGDVIVTGPKAYVQIRMADGTKFAIKPDTRFIIEAFEAPATDTEPAIGAGTALRASFNLEKGSLRSLSGTLAKRAPDTYQVSTPSAVIRVRGTNWIVGTDATGATSTGVSEGATTMTNGGGTLNLSQNQYGFAASFNSPPQRLTAPPTILQDGGLNNLEESEEESDGDGDGSGNGSGNGNGGDGEGNGGDGEGSGSGEGSGGGGEGSGGGGEGSGGGGEGSGGGGEGSGGGGGSSGGGGSGSGSGGSTPGGAAGSMASARTGSIGTGGTGTPGAGVGGGTIGGGTSFASTTTTTRTTTTTNTPVQQITTSGTTDGGTGSGTPVDLTGGGQDVIDAVQITERGMGFAIQGRAVGINTNNDTATFDAANSLTGFDEIADSTTTSYALGTASNQNVGFDPFTNIRWGRWAEGVATQTTGGTATDLDLANESLHWIIVDANETIPTQVVTGSANYTLVGNTDPTDAAGNVGVLGSASFSADFTNASVQSNVQLGINNQNWNATGTGSINSTFFNGLYNTVSVNGATAGNSGSFGGAFGGFGANGVPTGAGLTYQLTNGTTVVSGAAVFNTSGADQ